MSKNATNIILKIATKELIGELSHSLNTNVDTISLSSKKSGRATRLLPGRYGKEISFESLADDTNSADYGYATAHAAAIAGTLVAWTITRDAVTIDSGNGYIMSLTLDNPDNDKSTMSGSIKIDETT